MPHEPDASGDELIERLQRQLRARRRTLLLMAVFAGLLAAVVLPGVGLALFGEIELLLVALGRTIWGRLGLILAAVTLFAVVRHSLAESHVRKLADGLVAARDVRLIRPLIEAWAPGAGPTLQACGRALEHLLPMLRASDDDLLDETHRAVLREVLRGTDAYLAMATLYALEQVGSDDDIELVEALAGGRAGKSGLRLARDRRVSTVARDVLPGLRASANMRVLRHTLLRPAERPPGGAGHVRPAASPGDAGPEALLRPAEGGLDATEEARE